MAPDWKDLCKQKRNALLDSIPRDWIIPRLPIGEHPNVLDVPAHCGVLTHRELMITDTTDVDKILLNLRTGEWTSLETTKAFYKRAIIAHQLVGRNFLRSLIR